VLDSVLFGRSPEHTVAKVVPKPIEISERLGTRLCSESAIAHTCGQDERQFLALSPPRTTRDGQNARSELLGIDARKDLTCTQPHADLIGRDGFALGENVILCTTTVSGHVSRYGMLLRSLRGLPS